VTQLRKGAVQQRDQLFADLDAIVSAAQQAREYRKRNPDLAGDLQGEIIDLVGQIKRRYAEEIEPMLQRQAPPIEKRLADLEERLAALEQDQSPIRLVRRRKVR